MSREGQTTMTCGDVKIGVDFVHNVFYRLRETNLRS